MTLGYAKIARRTVADEYFAVGEKVEASTASPTSCPPAPPPEDDPAAPRAPPPARQRLGPRPPQLDCAFETICETCSYFQTSIEFRPALQAHHGDALAKNHTHRAGLFRSLITQIDQGQAS